MINNKLVIEYSNYHNSYIKVKSYNKQGLLNNELLIPLLESEIENGSINNVINIVNKITNSFLKISNIDLVLSCKQIYKTTTIYPKISISKAISNYKKELKSIQNNCTIITDYFAYHTKYIFNSYIIPNKIIDNFKRIAKLLNTKIDKITILGMYLSKQLNYSMDYAYLHIQNHVVTMLLVVDKKLMTTYTFEYNDIKEIRNLFLLIISKYEFELIRHPITHYGLKTDIPFTLNLGLTLIKDNDNEYIQKLYKEEMINDKNTTFSYRFEQALPSVKKRYNNLEKLIMSYSEVEKQITDICAVFYINNEVVFKIDLDKSKKTICLYINEDPNIYKKQKIQFTISDNKNFKNTPCLFRFSTNHRYRLAISLIKSLMLRKQISVIV